MQEVTENLWSELLNPTDQVVEEVLEEMLEVEVIDVKALEDRSNCCGCSKSKEMEHPSVSCFFIFTK